MSAIETDSEYQNMVELYQTIIQYRPVTDFKNWKQILPALKRAVEEYEKNHPSYKFLPTF